MRCGLFHTRCHSHFHTNRHLSQSPPSVGVCGPATAAHRQQAGERRCSWRPAQHREAQHPGCTSQPGCSDSGRRRDVQKAAAEKPCWLRQVACAAANDFEEEQHQAAAAQKGAPAKEPRSPRPRSRDHHCDNHGWCSSFQWKCQRLMPPCFHGRRQHLPTNHIAI